MIVDLNKDKRGKGKSLISYEVGILLGNNLQIISVKAHKWDVRNDLLVFFIEDGETWQKAIFRVWHYVKRVEEEDFIRPILVSREFVRTQIDRVKQKAPLMLGGPENPNA